MHGALEPGDTRDIAGHKCQDLTYDVSRSAVDVGGGGGNFIPK